MKKVLIVCLVIFLLIILGGSFVKASFSSGKSYARGYINWFIQRKWIGGKVSFANPNPDYVASSLGGLNQTLGIITNNGDLVYDSLTHAQTYSWVEVGYARGWASNYLDSKTYDPNARSLYTAREQPVNGFGYYAQRLSPIPIGPPGTVHNYLILYDSGVWKVYIDGIYDSYSNQPLYAKNIAVGLENTDSKNSAAPQVNLQSISYYYENQGWYSFGEANPKIQIESHDGGSYYFSYTNSSQDAAIDGMY